MFLFDLMHLEVTDFVLPQTTYVAVCFVLLVCARAISVLGHAHCQCAGHGGTHQERAASGLNATAIADQWATWGGKFYM